RDWFSNIRGDILAGIVVALALIPEAIAFSIIAGVDPMVGLYASFCIAVIISFTGGRPGMISAATGAMALLMVPLVKEYGLNYLLAATILTGVIQILFGVFKIAKFMKFIPNAVMIGFVNALAILIFMAQVPHFLGISNMTYVFVAVTLVIVYVVSRFIKSIPAPLIAIILLSIIAFFTIIYLLSVDCLSILIFMAHVSHFLGISNMTYVFVAVTLVIVYVVPRFIKSIPAPLIAIILLTSVALYTNIDLRTVGDLGSISSSLPVFLIPDVPFTLETLAIIFPYSLSLAIVGLLESLLTSSIVDDMTGTESNKNKEARGQGIANTITGFFGGMAGCAMIGQSVINV